MLSFLFRRSLAASIHCRALLHDSRTVSQVPLASEFEISSDTSHRSRLFSSSSSATKFDFTDLTCPHAWYPNARKKNRNIIIHVGPTNSGKTHQALKRLQTSSSGIYCGPLRLLAWEVAKRLNKANVPCDLITGQEREEVKDAKHKAVTVEMADVASSYACAIIDEIQMLASETRGSSFTRALLGLSANELHLCGDPASVPLIKNILKVTGDDVKVEYYERLSPLVPLKDPLGSFSNIQTGDCIVTFSKREIYRLKGFLFLLTIKLKFMRQHELNKISTQKKLKQEENIFVL